MRTISSILLIALFSIACQAQFVLVPPSDYNSLPLLQSTRDYGLNLTLNSLINSSKIVNTSYPITANNSIWNQTNGTVVSYKFNLTLANTNNDTVLTVFTVSYNSKTSKYLLVNTASSIKYGNTTKSNNTNSTSSNNSTNTTNGTNSTNSNNSTSYVAVPADQYTTPAVNDSLQFGKDKVIAGAITAGKIPNGTYNINLVNSVYKQVGLTSINYNCSVQIQNADLTRTVNASYIVNYKPSTGARTLTKSGYTVLPYKN